MIIFKGKFKIQFINNGIKAKNFRRGETQLDNTMLARVANGAYPEYRRVYELMTGRRVEHAYQRRISCQVLAIDTARRTILLASSNNGKFEVHSYFIENKCRRLEILSVKV